MRTFKIDYTMCSECFSTISIGQAKATSFVYGSAMCVKCTSGHNKFDAQKDIKIKTFYVETSL